MSSPSPRFSTDTIRSSTPTSPSAARPGYPFPDSLHRPTSSNVYKPRRGSNASITSFSSSVGGSLDPHAGGRARRNSALRETSQNTIAALLHPPILRTGLLPHGQAPGGFKPPTTKDIPPVALTNIPHVPPENFRDYLARVGPLFESFQRGRAEPEQPAWLKKDRELEKTDRFAEALERRWSRDGLAPSPTITRTGSMSTLSPVETSAVQPLRRRRSSGQIRRNRNEPTPLSTIPNVYFDEDFHLENPRTFDVVSERAEVVRPLPGTSMTEQKVSNSQTHPPRKALATNAILQEKLSWYMDTVEVHLINSISTASSGFFAALGSLKELQMEAEESVARIQALREDLRRLDQEVAVGGLEVAAKRRRRANVGKLAKATRQLERVVENVKRADELVDEGSYDEAADQMDRVGRLVCGQAESEAKADDLIDLRPLKALQGLDAGLQELQYRIGAGFAQRFLSILLADLREHVAKVPQTATLKRWSRLRGIPPTYMETTDQFRKNLLSALHGLGRAGHTAPATAAYREAVNKEMKALLKKYLPSSSEDDAESTLSTSTRGGSSRMHQQEKSSILARNLRAMDAEDAEKMLVNVYTSVGETLRRVGTQTKVLLDVTSSMQPTPSSAGSPIPKSPSLGGGKSRSPSISTVHERLSNGETASENAVSLPRTVQEELSQALDMSSLLGYAVDTAQAQITKVLKVRNEACLRLPPERFLRYVTLNRLFADECEAVSGRSGEAFKGLINAQIAGFVQVLAQAETQRIAAILVADAWNSRDFGAAEEAILKRVLGGMERDPEEWSKGTKEIWENVGRTPEMDRPTNGAMVSGANEVNGESTPDRTSTPTITANGVPSTAAVASGTKVAVQPAHIDEQKFILVGSATALLGTIDTLLSLTAVLGAAMTPAISAALLDVLRVFNSRCQQLILGAGATKTAGLKNITTKHLALASQALGFVVALVPYVRECVRRHLGSAVGGSTAVLAEWDKTKRLYQDHQAGIHDKLVDIMTARSGAHVSTMRSLPWDSPEDDGKPSAYMETLTKETLTLHRVLSRHLPAFDVQMIMRRIFETYRTQWTAAFGEVGVEGEAAERRVVRDVACFEARLGRIEGFEGTVGEEVGRVVKAMVEVKEGADEGKEVVKEERKEEAKEEAKEETKEEAKVEGKDEGRMDGEGGKESKG